ncbi:peroxidase family protein [Actinoplanes sp. N902-109]|uniref:peroxidase family protein n=1 Tax=Actinoplanes sp. (strain N902-109) TaxID=649831 RepID=UPI0003294AEF|nr:peroxidase family protein [Actinoplanes sp. N902-109]AGL19306.1 peroxidase family protein [Actinoplanes sp. N902-109]
MAEIERKSTTLSDLYAAITEYIDHRVGWDRLPTLLGLAELIGLRTRLREQNLHDTTSLPAVNRPPLAEPQEQQRINRSADGSYNDLSEPRMGMAGSRFGRNVPLSVVKRTEDADVLTPNPRAVSRALLTRHDFVPATTVNSLVAAWLQFMIRDWFSHGTSPKENPWVVPLADDDPWPQPPMHIMRTPPDPTRPPTEDSAMPPTTINVNSHWWDASQIYGVTAAEQQALRSGEGGKLNLGMPKDVDTMPGFWIGLALMQRLFAAEHNAICDMLHDSYPSWTDEELFQRARLITAALIAKIHTVEWTPAVISHPTTVAALRANWFGVAGERVHKLFGRISPNEVISGIPGARTDHFGVPFALTEEFVAVYRMHPLIRDDWHLRAAADNRSLREASFRDLAGPNGTKLMSEIDLTDLLYSFGTLPPGLVTLHNFPKFLQEYERPDGKFQDLAATDLLRSRELGVPRYNEFRRLLHLKPAATFEELTGNAEWAQQIEQAYDGDIEKVDVTVGMFAEKLPPGFAFSDTAFRIFILMASRRLNSDRFFTDYYTPEVYTREGLAWIDNNTMGTILLRHHPELRPAMAQVHNAFQPWRVTAPAEA